MRTAKTADGAATLRTKTQTVNTGNEKSFRASKQPPAAPRRPIPPPPSLPAGDPSPDMIVARFVLDDLIEEARELPFDQALTQFDGIAELLTGNADLRACRDALLTIKYGARVLDQLRAEAERLRQ